MRLSNHRLNLVPVACVRSYEANQSAIPAAQAVVLAGGGGGSRRLGRNRRTGPFLSSTVEAGTYCVLQASLAFFPFFPFSKELDLR